MTTLPYYPVVHCHETLITSDGHVHGNSSIQQPKTKQKMVPLWKQPVGAERTGDAGLEVKYSVAPWKRRGAAEVRQQQRAFLPPLPWSSTAKYQGSS